MRLINRIIPGEYRYPTITPFTIPDGHTYLKTLEWLIQRMKQIIDDIDENNAEILDLVVEVLNTKIDEINDAFTEFEGEVDDKLASVDTKIGDLETFVNDSIQSIINNSIEAQDPVVAGLVRDRESETGLEIVDTIEEFSVKRGSQFIDPMDYGAVGDGVANDTLAIQAAVNALEDGGTLLISRVYKCDAVFIDSSLRHWVITGGGTIIDGTIVVGSETTPNAQFWNIENITFIATVSAGDSVVDDTEAIRLRRTSRGTIQSCVFIGHDKAIHRAGIDAASGAFHSTATIKIFKNEFNNVNYPLYVKYGIGENWQSINDCKFISNTINRANVAHLWVEGIDGFVVDGNVCFFLNYNSTDTEMLNKKTNNIYIGQSDWLIITNNNLFEAGLESIKLVQPRHFTVANNMIAWPGQREMSNAVDISSNNSFNGLVQGNNISQFTKHAVAVDCSGNGRITVENNNYEYYSTASSYFGTEPLDSIQHYGTYDADTNNIQVFDRNNTATPSLSNYRRGRIGSAVPVGYGASRTSAVTLRQVSATEPIELASVAGGASSSGINGGPTSGMVIVTVRNNQASSANLASYMLHVWKYGAVGSGSQGVTEVSSGGLTAGAAIGHPSFTFSMNSNGKLVATPVGQTASTFDFEITALGDISLFTEPANYPNQ